MKTYRVIQRFAVRDSLGNSTGKYIDPPHEISLNDVEAARLMTAGCVVPVPTAAPVEKAVITAPEHRDAPAEVEQPQTRRRGRQRR